MDNALADLELRKEDEKFTLQAIASFHGVDRSALSKRWRGVTGPRSDGYAQQQLFSPQQEDELVRYIEDLSAKSLPPTRTMIVTTQARQEIRIWRGLTQRHMGVRGRTVT
jgi:hypothetical protein